MTLMPNHAEDRKVSVKQRLARGLVKGAVLAVLRFGRMPVSASFAMEELAIRQRYQVCADLLHDEVLALVLDPSPFSGHQYGESPEATPYIVRHLHARGVIGFAILALQRGVEVGIKPTTQSVVCSACLPRTLDIFEDLLLCSLDPAHDKVRWVVE